MILSYLESFIPAGVFSGIPGFKLGFANISVLVVFFAAGAGYAASVSAVRIILSSLLFGSITTLWFSFLGGLFSFAVLLLAGRLYSRYIGLAGISVLCAAMHNFGQITAASAVMRDAAVFAYLPYLLLLSVPCGLITGSAAGIILSYIRKIQKDG